MERSKSCASFDSTCTHNCAHNYNDNYNDNYSSDYSDYGNRLQQQKQQQQQQQQQRQRQRQRQPFGALSIDNLVANLSDNNAAPGLKPHLKPTLKSIMARGLKHEHESFDCQLQASALASASAQQHLQQHSTLTRNDSQQSDSSHYSSVDSLLESRRPDPEAILINLGFGPVGSDDILSRIPKRFLKPSKLRGIDTESFVRRLQISNTLVDHSVLGYRGLTGNPDMPASKIVAKIMARFEKSLSCTERTIR